SALVRGEDTLGVETAISRLPRPVQERVVAVLELVRGRPDSAERMAERLRTDPAQRDSISDSHLQLAALLDAWSASVRRDASLTGKLAVADSLSRGRTTLDQMISLALTRLHENAGDPTRAVIALRRVQLFLGSPPADGIALRLRLEGKLAARTGEREAAIKAYRAYLWYRSDPEPRFIPQRDSVRAELAALERRS
ncbi:MAG: hypothetical protein ACT4PM_11265, partial [Gemmatimonadales bacterium]